MIQLFNLNDIGNQRVYNRVVTYIRDIAAGLDAEKGTKYTEAAESGELTVQDLILAMNFSDNVYSEYDNYNNRYVMIPFCAVINKKNGDDKDIFLFYSCTDADSEIFGRLGKWLSSVDYDVKNNITKLTDEEGVKAVEMHNTVLISGDNIYKMKS